MSQVIPIGQVIPLHDMNPTGHQVRKMAEVLKKQGQIEPLQVHYFEDSYLVFNQDVHGTEIVHAARMLGWDTLLIVVMNRYEA